VPKIGTVAKIGTVIEMPRGRYKSINVREDTYQLFQRYRGKLFMEKGRKVTEDETLRELLAHVLPEIKT